MRPVRAIARDCAFVALAFLAALAIQPDARAEDKRAGLDIPFILTRPAGDGPFPAIVMLHDCSGLGPHSSGAPWRWSTELTRLGYVTIWPDSFSTREFADGVCTESDRRRRVGPKIRAADAYAALRYLQAIDYVDPKRIAVMGGSHGGSTTLASIVALQAHQTDTAPGFAAAIALYPSCNVSYGNGSSSGQGLASASSMPPPTRNRAGSSSPLLPR